MARDTLASLRQEVENLRALLAAGDAEKVAFWADLEAEANTNELCEQYDEFAKRWGGPPRNRQVKVVIRMAVPRDTDIQDVLSDVTSSMDSYSDFGYEDIYTDAL